jgi:hypothetical protein
LSDFHSQLACYELPIVDALGFVPLRRAPDVNEIWRRERESDGNN